MVGMAEPIYLGIENEFQLHSKKKLVNFDEYFGKLLAAYSSPYFKKGETAIRTVVGSSIYQDIEVAEVSTPPLQLEVGVATKAADLLYLARRELVKFISPVSHLNLIGYSMHYNITDSESSIKKDKALSALAIPYQLFCLNPSSGGLRFRNSKNGKCLEITSDYLYEEDQIRAFLNLFIGTIPYATKKDKRVPFVLSPSYIEDCFVDDFLCLNKVARGRNSRIEVICQKEHRHSLFQRLFRRQENLHKTITAQEYLEEYYGLFHDEIAHFATPSEIRNLESFVYGRNPLEADKGRKYSVYIRKKEDGGLKYDCRFILRKENFLDKRELPGKIARNLSRMTQPGENARPLKGVENSFPLDVLSLEWNVIILRYRQKRYWLDGIHVFEMMENIMQSSDEHSWPRLIGKFAMLSEDMSLSELQMCAAEILKSGKRDIDNATYEKLKEAKLIDRRYKLTPDGRIITEAILDFNITSELFKR